MFVYGGIGQGVLAALAARYPDLRGRLRAIDARLGDLLPVTQRDLVPSGVKRPWSIEDLLPTIAPELDPGDLGEVRDDGTTSRLAYAEAAHPSTSPERADELRSRPAGLRRPHLALALAASLHRLTRRRGRLRRPTRP